MRLLFVTHFFPYPPTDGGRLGYLNPIKYLSRKNEIVLASMTEPGDTQYIPELERYCMAVQTYRRRGVLDPVRLAKGFLTDPPGTAAKYWDRSFGRLIRGCLKQFSIDLVEFEHLNTAAYGRFASSAPKLLREHNVEYKVWERYAVHAEGSVERLFVRLCAPRVRMFEAAMSTRFDRCLVVSPAEARHLRKVAPQARVEMIPSGVDTEYFYPNPEVQEEPYRMVVTGSFEWKPKQHNLRVLLSEIMPRIQAKIPAAKLDVVGKGVPRELQTLAERTPGVTVTGTVPDVRPYVWRSSLVLNYLESGGGIALKVLEAMAMKKAVLSNSLGCEGIEVVNGRDAHLADGPERFAEAAAHLLNQRAQRHVMGDNGCQTVRARYSWAVIANQFQDLYESVVSESKREKSAGVRRESAPFEAMEVR